MAIRRLEIEETGANNLQKSLDNYFKSKEC